MKIKCHSDFKSQINGQVYHLHSRFIEFIFICLLGLKNTLNNSITVLQKSKVLKTYT
jgi:hypothetical protein